MQNPTSRLYEIGLSFFEGIGPVRYKSLIRYFGSASEVFSASDAELKKSGLSDAVVTKFIAFREKTNLRAVAQSVQEKNIKVLVQNDEEYPEMLKEIPSAPFILYALGNISYLRQELPIGIVGTRQPTRYGTEVTRTFTKHLVRAGCTIISGMAMGVDAVAHTAALDESGKTVAVLGCGVDICYPAVNRQIYDLLRKDGLVISEFPPGMRTSKGVFPSRNRIIAGLSCGVLVTEGTDKSGSLITARNAADFGRDVFVVPGPITSPMSEAGLILMQNGAKAVGNADDIISEYAESSERMSREAKVLSLEKLSQEELRIVGLITREGSVHIDSLVRTMPLSSSEIFSLISRLELSGVVSEIGEGIYTIRV